MLAWTLGCVACAACNGGLLVTPTSSSSLPPVSPPSPPPPRDTLVLLHISGTLEDGGTFEGTLIYGSRDQDGRVGFGRFQGGFWDVTVRGGSRTKDVRFTDGTGGRALIETNLLPFPAVGIIVLWPEEPARQALTPHMELPPKYDVDTQPSAAHFGALIPAVPGEFGFFHDGEGGQTAVVSIVVR